MSTLKVTVGVRLPSMDFRYRIHFSKKLLTEGLTLFSNTLKTVNIMVKRWVFYPVSTFALKAVGLPSMGGLTLINLSLRHRNGCLISSANLKVQKRVSQQLQSLLKSLKLSLTNAWKEYDTHPPGSLTMYSIRNASKSDSCLALAYCLESLHSKNSSKQQKIAESQTMRPKPP